MTNTAGENKLFEMTLKELRLEDLEKLKAVFPDGGVKRRSEWKIPVGECMVTFSVEGPTTKTDAELFQYAIDVMEVAKKHSEPG